MSYMQNFLGGLPSYDYFIASMLNYGILNSELLKNKGAHLVI